MIEGWEIGVLYWNRIRKFAANENKAVQKVREKYFDKFTKQCDVLLFLGTTQQFHGWANNPFVIIGVFYPPKELTRSLF